MAINGINNQSNISSLYNSIFGIGSNSDSGSSYGISDFAMIRNGSYGKLMKAYYKKAASDDPSSSSVSAATSTSKDSSKTLANIESAADDLKKASEALRTNGDKSLFTKKQTTDKDGKVSYEYDTDLLGTHNKAGGVVARPGFILCDGRCHQRGPRSLGGGHRRSSGCHGRTGEGHTGGA